MSVIAVLGASGTAGRPLTTRLREQGHEVRALSRRSPGGSVDLDTGAGLREHLAGCEVVVDVANSSPRQGRLLPLRSERLAEAARAAGVAHLVLLSIAGIEEVPTGYYRGKVAQEEVVRAGAVPWTIVRSTQFHELLAAAFGALARARLSPRAAFPLQPIAAGEAASALARVAAEEPARRTLVVSGPAPETLSELARTWSRVHGRRLLPVPLPLPPRMRAPLSRGALVGPAPDERGSSAFAAWLEQSTA